MMHPLVSVIVPVHNAEKFLPQCLQSILEGDLQNWELILVNDGSTDGTGTMCQRYRDKDSRVKVLNLTQQTGVSQARNKGLEFSSGAYIAFVDGDDWVDTDMYRNMVDRIDMLQSDMVMCSYSIYDGAGEEVVPLPWVDNPTFERAEIETILIPALISPLMLDGQRQKVLMGSIWRVLFNREFIIKNGLAFDSRIIRTEDLAFMVQALSRASRVCILNQPYYHYRQDRRHGISTTHRHVDDLYASLMCTYAYMEEAARPGRDSDHFPAGLAWRKIEMVLVSIHNLALPGAPWSFRAAAQQARWYLADCGFKVSVRQINHRVLTPKQKISVWLLRSGLVEFLLGYYFLKYNHSFSSS